MLKPIPKRLFDSPRLRAVLPALFAFSPALVTAALIATHAVNVPVWDGWERGVLLEKAANGELDFGYLFSAHIDHRPVIPRLITLAANALSGGDVRAEMAIGFLAVVAGAIGLLLALRKSLPSPAWCWGTMFALNLLIFSPLQYQNFLWAVQLAFLLPLGCLGLLLAVMTSGWRPLAKGLAAAGLASVATLSFGHGLILWPVAVCMALLHPAAGAPRTRLALGGVLAAVAAATVALYFNWNYVNTSQPWHAYGALPGEPPPAVDRFANLRENSDRVADYFWASLGNPVARLLGSDPLAVAVDAGRALLALFGIASIWMLAGARREGRWAALLPWAACAAFAVVAALMMATGRGADLPLERALYSRYASLTGYLPIGLVAMAACALSRWRGAAGSGAALVGIGLLAGAQSQAYVYGAHKMAAWKMARLEERFHLLYAAHKTPRFPALIDGGMQVAEGEEPFAVRQARFLDGRGWLSPPMFERFDFGGFERLDERALAKRSDLLFAGLHDEATLHLAGYATLPDGRIADGVLVTWRRPGDDPPRPAIERSRKRERIHGERVAALDWALLDVLGVRAAPAMRASFEDGQFGANKMNLAKRENYARFEDPVDLSPLPEGGEVEICLWVADCEHMQVAPLKRMFRFDRGEAAPGEVLVEVD